MESSPIGHKPLQGRKEAFSQPWPPLLAGRPAAWGRQGQGVPGCRLGGGLVPEGGTHAQPWEKGFGEPGLLWPTLALIGCRCGVS